MIPYKENKKKEEHGDLTKFLIQEIDNKFDYRAFK